PKGTRITTADRRSVWEKITGIGSTLLSTAMAAASMGLVGTADRNAWAKVSPLLRAKMAATTKMQNRLAIAVPMIIGAWISSLSSADGVNVRPTWQATITWPNGLIPLGTLITSRRLMHRNAVKTS